MKKTRILLIVTALIVCMSGQSFAAEGPEAGSAAESGAVNAVPAQTEAEAKAQAGIEPAASANEAQTETQTGEQTETKADSQTPAQAVPKQDVQPEARGQSLRILYHHMDRFKGRKNTRQLETRQFMGRLLCIQERRRSGKMDQSSEVQR